MRSWLGRHYAGYMGDLVDIDGHGTHVAGTILGMPVGKTLGQVAQSNVGIAPDAKISFMDASNNPPGGLFYFPFVLDWMFDPLTATGAWVQSSERLVG